jgi:hypothetical protein
VVKPGKPACVPSFCIVKPPNLQEERARNLDFSRILYFVTHGIIDLQLLPTRCKNRIFTQSQAVQMRSTNGTRKMSLVLSVTLVYRLILLSQNVSERAMI